MRDLFAPLVAASLVIAVCWFGWGPAYTENTSVDGAKFEKAVVNGHDYLFIARKGNYTFTAVHDPDCRCAHKTAEKEK